MTRWMLLFALVAASGARALSPGDWAPAFKLKDLQGKEWTQAEKGWVLVDFWASWCSPCIKEIPLLNALQDAHPAKLRVLGISADKTQAAMLGAVKKRGIRYAVAWGDQKLAGAYGVQFPTAYLLKDGKVVKVLKGERKKGDFEKEVGKLVEGD